MLASLQIARALKLRKAKTTVFVPHFAMSGGTLIALAADEIVMSPHAVLGSVDPQINGLPAVSIVRAAEQKPLAEIDDQTLILADVGRKAIGQIRAAVSELLQEHIPKERADELADRLSRGEWTHDYPISPTEAQSLGLLVSTDMPAAVLELMTLYPQPVRTQPSVEYLPRRRSDGEMPASDQQ